MRIVIAVVVLLFGVAVAAVAVEYWQCKQQPLFHMHYGKSWGIFDVWINTDSSVDRSGTFAFTDTQYNMMVVIVTDYPLESGHSRGEPIGRYATPHKAVLFKGAEEEVEIHALQDTLLVIHRGNEEQFHIASGEAVRLETAFWNARAEEYRTGGYNMLRTLKKAYAGPDSQRLAETIDKILQQSE